MRKRTFPRDLTGAALTACLAVFGLALPADAQPSGTPQPGAFKPRSEGMATSLSFFGTAVPIALAILLGHEGSGSAFWWVAVAAIPVGPALGHFYAGEHKRAWTGIGIRVAALAAFSAGVAMAFDETHSSSYPLTLGLILAGATVALGSTLADIVDARESVWKHNLKGQGLTLNVSPVVSPRSKAVGIQAQIKF